MPEQHYINRGRDGSTGGHAAGGDEDAAKSLIRPEERLARIGYPRNPHECHRPTITNVGKQTKSGDIPCRRMLGADGSLSEIVRLDGTRAGLSDTDFERFIESFPIKRA
jgi:hypothetical protein